jgi:uncharacterized membrane protein YraQ (UPF0718 family)
MLDFATTFLMESWRVLGQMAPYLIFGFLVAGILSVSLSASWLERHLGRGGMGPVVKASLFGIPLPLCSCSVIPVAASIRASGASRAATTSFLLSAPQTGIDSILVTHAMLGPLFAIYRPVAALLTGVVGGGLVRSFVEGRGDTVSEGQNGNGASDSAVAGASVAACGDGCCATATNQGRQSCGCEEGDPASENRDASVRKVDFWRRVFRYGFLTLPRDIGPALAIGILIAGVMAALVPPNRLEAYLGGGVLSLLLLMAAGVPVYVCATASVPIAAGLMYMGASPGGALAFLIAGPATNAATFTTVWKILGRRTAFLHLVTVAASALGCGLLLDWLMPLATGAYPRLAKHIHAHETISRWSHLWAILLVAIMIYAIWWGPRASRRRGPS